MFGLQPDNDFNKRYVMLPKDNLSFGYMDIWGLETDGQFQAAVS